VDIESETADWEGRFPAASKPWMRVRTVPSLPDQAVLVDVTALDEHLHHE
jgi:hypothetical protein